MVLLRRELFHVRRRRQLDVHRNAVRILSCLFDEFLRRTRDRFEMNVALELMILAQGARDLHDLLHGEVRRADDAGGKEQAFDVIAPVKIERQLHHFLYREPCALHAGGDAVDAINAVENAIVREQHFQQRHTAPVRRERVANAHSIDGSEPFAVARVALLPAAAGAGSVVFRGVGEDGKLGGKFHGRRKKGSSLTPLPISRSLHAIYAHSLPADAVFGQEKAPGLHRKSGRYFTCGDHASASQLFLRQLPCEPGFLPGVGS